MTSFEDFSAALDARETLMALIRQTVEEMQPPYRYALAVQWDRYERWCLVQFPEGGDPVKINMGAIEPTAVNQVVRVAGVLGDRYLDAVIGQAHMVTNEVELGANGEIWTNNFVPGNLNNYSKIQFTFGDNTPTNNWDFTNHQYEIPQDGIYQCSGVIRAFWLGVAQPQTDWATTLFVNGVAGYRLDEFLQPYPGNVPIELRLDFQLKFFAGTIIDFRFYNGILPATIQCASGAGEVFSYFRIDLVRIFI